MEHGGLQSMGLQRVGHDLAVKPLLPSIPVYEYTRIYLLSRLRNICGVYTSLVLNGCTLGHRMDIAFPVTHVWKVFSSQG